MRHFSPVLIALMLAGPSHAAELTGTLRKIKDSGTITLGLRDRSFPFSYLNGSQPIGYAVDICMHVATAVKRELDLPNLKVDVKFVTASNRISLVAAGQIDLECSTTTNNIERQRQVAFSNTFYLSASRFLTRRDRHLTSIESLRDRTVVATSGTTNLNQLNQLNLALSLNMIVLEEPDTAKAFNTVATGQADAFALDDIQLSSLRAASPDPALYTISTDALSAAEPYGVMLRRNDPEFKAVVDQATADLFQSGAGPALYAKWFQSPTPPNGLNLKLPMPANLRHAFEHPSDSADPARYAP